MAILRFFEEVAPLGCLVADSFFTCGLETAGDERDGVGILN